MFDDFKIKVICKYDYTFWLHMLRDFILAWISWQGAIGFNLAFEWQDGLHNDGFNILDFLAGCVGIGINLLIRGLYG
jgi:hypothetical protein